MVPMAPQQFHGGFAMGGPMGGPGGAHVMSLDAGPLMPPTPGQAPGAAGFAGKMDQNQVQQKMARQRQLALERRRMAGRMTAGGMAQANQLPAATSQLPSKAPGWDRVLGEGIDVKPGSLAEKAEAAFNDAKRPQPLGLNKAGSQLPTLDEKGEVETMSTALAGADRLESGSKRPNTNSGGGIEEIEVSDILDFDQPSFEPSFGRKPGPMQMPGSNGQREQLPDAGKGWSLQVEEPAPVQEAAPEAQQGEGRRWYKPSTWNKPKPAAKVQQGNSDVTTVQGFGDAGCGVQRLGLRTPDSDDGKAPLTFSGPKGSPARRRPRNETASPAPNTAAEIDYGFMDCPGAIIDTPLPVAPVPLSKAQNGSSAKHFSADVERAAFPSEERRRVATPEKPTYVQRPQARPTASLAELEAQKKDAIAREDFMAAQRIKGEIEALQAQAPAPRAAPAQNNSVQSFSAPRNSDDVVDAMLSDEVSGFGSRDREDRQNGGAAREAPGSSWNAQAAEPARVSPTPEEPVRKRFWKRAAKPTL